MVEVQLTITETRHAAYIGCERMLRNLQAGRKHRWGFKGPNEWTNHIQAAGSELAVAKVLGRYYVDSEDPDPAGDVGPRVQVRWARRDTDSLILHPSDSDDHYFILVVGALPTYQIVGYLRGRDGKRPEYWRDFDRPAFFVPQGALKLDRLLPHLEAA